MRAFEEYARWVSSALLAMVVAATNVHAGGPQPEPPRMAQSTKIKASGRMVLCHMNARAKGFLGAIDPQHEEDLLGKCSTKLGSAFLKAEAKCEATGAVGCVTGDAPILTSRIQTLSDHLGAFLAQEAVPAQRYVDNGDGTITDNRTGLQWEKKTTTVGSGQNFADPHDVDNLYRWNTTIGGTTPNGPAFTDFLGKLNDCASSNGTAATVAGFAGHCDWRLPTIQELQTIIDLDVPGCGSVSHCIDPIFEPTGGNLPPPLYSVYWSATTTDGFPANAWLASFNDGDVDGGSYKGAPAFVRAVRGP